MIRYSSTKIPVRIRMVFWLRRALAAGLAVLFILMTMSAASAAAARARLAHSVLRFHVLANSDSSQDQTLKLQVRDALLTVLREALGDGTGELAETEAIVKDRLEQLEQTAREVVLREGYDYAVKVKLTSRYFPEKVCGVEIFPAGRYETLQAVIGEGGGHNWWGLLFPADCFLEAVRGIAPEEGEEIHGVLEDAGISWKDADFHILTKWF